MVRRIARIRDFPVKGGPAAKYVPYPGHEFFMIACMKFGGHIFEDHAHGQHYGIKNKIVITKYDRHVGPHLLLGGALSMVDDNAGHNFL